MMKWARGAPQELQFFFLFEAKNCVVERRSMMRLVKAGPFSAPIGGWNKLMVTGVEEVE